MEPSTPDRPELAPEIWLVGRLEESALEDPPWAVEQAKRGYLQMGELAYRVAEQANGEQSIEEIATAVSTALRRPVSAQDVEALIATVLIPRGIVRGAEEAPPPAPLRQGVGSQRERVVGPERLEAVASILMWLFWPPVALAVTASALAMLIWLYAMHGLAQAVIQVLREPVLLPLVLALAALGAAVQGIGPMVALYSGGARIEHLRYTPGLPWPRFVVDMADDYGLSRWARLLVNLSGVHLLLALTLVLSVVGLATGADFLFLAVALLTLTMLRLLLPFGRPGADRLLADWLLVPEPLRYAEAALERRLPGIARDTRPLPALKHWGHITIWLSLLAVIGLLLFAGVAILWAAPTVAATTLAALTAYLTGMVDAVGDRDAVRFLGSLFRAGLLTVMSFVLIVGLIVGGRSLLTSAWRWSRATPRRRLLGSIGAILLAVVVLVFWAPVRGFGDEDGPPRTLAGASWGSLTPASRGTIFDLFQGDVVVAD